MSLPVEINYTMKPTALPSGTSLTSVVSAPSNGSTFQEGSIIYLDMVSRGYLVPSSLYIRYKLSVSTDATLNPYIRGIPAYAPFARSECVIGSSIVETIQGYNQVSSMVVNTKLNTAQKVGLSASLGLLDQATTPTFDNVDGYKLSPSVSILIPLSAPLGNMFSACQQLLPLGKMPACRLQLTLDALSNIVSVGGTAMTISNVELCYDIVDFGPEVDAAVDSMVNESGEIVIKSQGFMNSSQIVPAGLQGSTELVYGLRLASIKSLYALFVGTNAAYNPSAWASSRDITSNSGDIAFTISGKSYPDRPISTTLNKAAFLSELSNSWGPSHDILTSNFAITQKQFYGYLGSGNVADPVSHPSRFIMGVNCEKLSSNGVLLSGVSSQNTPLTLRINTSVPTAQTFNVNVIALFDALIKVNPATRQASVMI
jgi:hypothetical protein